MSFLLFLVGFLEKWTKREKSGQLRGSFAAAKRSLATTKVLATSRDPSSLQSQEGRLALPQFRRCEAIVHSMKMLCFVLFCYSIIPRFVVGKLNVSIM